MTDSSDLLGHSYSYASATYGLIIRKAIEAGTSRFILHLDEFTRTSKAIYNSLIHLIDFESNDKFQDRFYAGIDFDFSDCIIIATYNSDHLENITEFDTAISERIDEIKIDAYDVLEKIEICKRFLIPKAERIINVKTGLITITNPFIKYIIMNYTAESGTRTLNKLIMKIYEKINYMHSIHNLPITRYELTLDHLHKLLGEIPSITAIDNHAIAGKVKVMYEMNDTIGGLINVQISKNYLPDQNYLLLTGNQQVLTKESCQCAFNVISQIVSCENFSKYGFHCHISETSLVKNGSSAGCAFAIAFYSLIMNKKINPYVAMTGEICLNGFVHKIGGLKNKLIGAIKNGIKIVFIPKENESELSSTSSSNTSACVTELSSTSSSNTSACVTECSNEIALKVIFVNHIREILDSEDLFIN